MYAYTDTYISRSIHPLVQMELECMLNCCRCFCVASTTMYVGICGYI